jgi:23S rRNA (adenine2030-N6)-methyltransferase
MNYRHAYHAGNFADIVKHAALALVVEHLKRKDSPFVYVDTHAGTGLYDLTSVQAEKTGEWMGGIGLVAGRQDAPPQLAPYLSAVRSFNPDGGLAVYPGSPAVAAALARPCDRLALCELHPEDAGQLKHRFAADPRVGVHQRDAYEAMKALLPPPERRGVVLVDPPFEIPGEFERLRKGLQLGLKRWGTGIFLLWYPIKDRAVTDRFLADLAMVGLGNAFAAELMLRPADNPGLLNGTGLVVVNPPWQLEESLAVLLPWLAEVLSGGKGSWRIAPVTPPSR